MELIFTTPGTYLNVKDGLIAISSDNQKSAISPAKVERIILTTDAVITTTPDRKKCGDCTYRRICV